MQTNFLKELTDFTDLRKRPEQFNSVTSKQSGSILGAQLDIQNNQMIMKSFRELRQKLKNSQKQSQQLRQEIKSQQVQIVQLHQSQNNLRLINHQLKEKNSQIQLISDEFKKKNMLLKQSLSQKSQLQEQLTFMKNSMVDLQMKYEKVQEEKKKLIQIAIEQKINFQQKINKLMFKSNSDDQYLCEMEQEVSKSKQTILKLQNQLKKIQIKYDEEIFNKQWSKENFEQEKSQSYIKQLENEVHELKSKLKKQKQRKNQIQKRVIQLQQVAGIWNVKAQVYQGQVGAMNKKVKKMERRMSNAKVTANKMTNQKICWQQRFFKAVFISEQLINRVKRQLMGDMVELAKSCEFRINKLKQGKQTQILKPSSGKQTYNILNKKLFKSDKKQRKSAQKYVLTTAKAQTETTGKHMTQVKGGALSEINHNYATQAKHKNTQSLSRSQFSGNQENHRSISQSYSSMELKIRKERQQMEKKLRQKMLFRKIQVCTTPDKGKLRQDYLKLIYQK